MFSEYNFRSFNIRILLYVMALTAVGIVVINSAVAGDTSYTEKQLSGFAGGLCMAAALAFINYRWLLKFNWVIYLGCIVILAAVILNGALGGGSMRWIELPVIGRFQPSEFVKIGLILFFSWYLEKYQEKINRPLVLLSVAVFAAVPLFLILEQPDLSTSIVIAVFILCLIFAAGIDYKWILGSIAVVVPLGGIMLFLAEQGMVPFLRGYQVNRILAFIMPEKYAELNLQQDNSMMAIGSGQLYGKGLFNDTAISVKNGNFLSEEHTDFIFSVLGEEMGFVGCMAVLALYLLLIYECLRTASRARDLSGRLICTGVAALVGFQAFTNIAVATGVFPNTGLPLPFLSYGVSSLVSLYIGIGIVLNVGLQRSTKPEY